MKTYKILIACGTGIATSTVIADRVKNLCEQNGFNVVVEQTRVVQLEGIAANFDLIVASTQVPSTIKTPYVTALSYLTGINREQTDAEIIDKLKEIASKG